VGDGPWWNNFNTGDGVFPADAQWIWSSDGNNHNDVFCRIQIDC
jgi:hypothetical protein